MKSPLLKILALFVSLSLAGGYVWYASKKGRPPEKPMVRDAASPPADEGILRTGDEAMERRVLLLPSSKQGGILSEEDVREMLEAEKREAEEEEKAPPPPEFLPSSKSIDAVLDAKDVERLLERTTKPEEAGEK